MNTHIHRNKSTESKLSFVPAAAPASLSGRESQSVDAWVYETDPSTECYWVEVFVSNNEQHNPFLPEPGIKRKPKQRDLQVCPLFL